MFGITTSTPDNPAIRCSYGKEQCPACGQWRVFRTEGERPGTTGVFYRYTLRCYATDCGYQDREEWS